MTAIKELADLGAVFQSLACISFGSEHITRGWWPIAKIECAGMDVALGRLGFAR